MADIAIVYASVHHGNTKKLLEGISQKCDVDLFDVLGNDSIETIDFSKYEVVGFASGIYMSRFHKSITGFLDKGVALPKKTFVMYTSGSGSDKYGQTLTDRLTQMGTESLGMYHCKGYDTFGPFKLVGGIAKGHPKQNEIDLGVKFIENIACK